MRNTEESRVRTPPQRSRRTAAWSRQTRFPARIFFRRISILLQEPDMKELGFTLNDTVAGDPERVLSVAKKLAWHEQLDFSPPFGKTWKLHFGWKALAVDLDPIPTAREVIVANNDDEILIS